MTATIPDGAAGSDQYLTYKWNVESDSADGSAKAAAAKPMARAAAPGTASQSSTIPVDTSKVGTTTYTCTVTNTLSGKSVTSEAATITVNEKAPKPDDKPSTDNKGDNANADNTNANKGNNANADTAPSKKSPAKAAPGRLVSTGDTNNAMVPVAIAIAGVAIVVQPRVAVRDRGEGLLTR